MIRESYLPPYQKILLQQIAGGDVNAFRELFDAYRVRLYAAALKITKSAYAAEEIVQEIFTSLWESRSALKEVNNPQAYIFTIAYHKTFRHLKKAAADASLLQALKQRAREGYNETEEWLEGRESQAFIDQAVRQLPPQRQLIYRLSREQLLTHEQIASELKISPLTVKKQLVLALRNIRSSLARMISVLGVFFLPHLF